MIATASTGKNIFRERILGWSSTKLLVVFSLLIAATVGALLYINFSIAMRALEQDFHKEAHIYSDTFYSLQKTAEKNLQLVASIIAGDHEVQALFQAGRRAVEAEGGGAGGTEASKLRQQLYDLVAERWEFTREGLKASQLHFHLAPGATSFLRVHRPDRYGDDLSGLRFSIVDTHRELSARSGFEIGRMYAGIRGVVPVTMNTGDGSPSRLIGALEAGLSHSTIVETLKQVTGSDVTVLLDRQQAETTMWPEGIASQQVDSHHLGNFIIEASSSALPDPVYRFLQDNEPGTLPWNAEPALIKAGVQHYVATFFPLRDYLGQRERTRQDVGHVVIWQDVSQRMNEFRERQTQTLVLGLLAYLALESLMIFGFRRLTTGLRREVHATAEALSNSLTQRQFFEQILDNVEEAVFLINESGRFEYINSAVTERLGYDNQTLLGMTVQDVDTEFDMAQWPTHWQQLKELGNLMFESRHRDSKGQTFPVEINANFVSYQGTDYNLALVRNISERKQYEQELHDSSERYKSIIATARDGFFMVDNQGSVVEVNESYCRMTGFDRAQLVGRKIAELEAQENEQDVKDHIERIIAQGNDLFESTHWRKDGSTLPVEVAVSYSAAEGGRFFSFIRDIHERKQHERLSRLRDNLSALAHQGDVERVLRTSLDTAEELSRSSIAFYHFVDPGEDAISLQTWSTRTQDEMCTASGEIRHYPVSQAGVWVDCIHERRAVIHNDYPSLNHRKGLPPGHAPVTRFVTVPIIRNDNIVAIIGVGNKESFYDDEDVALIERIGEMAYDFAQHCETKQHVEYMAYFDVLTGLPNRELFFERLNQNIAQHARSGNLLALCYLDLDGFKPINDEHGHATGDQLLIRIGSRLQAALREGDTIARIGGDEFVILLTALESAQEAEQIVTRLISETSAPFNINGMRLFITASVGITMYPTDDTNPDTLLRHADQAMYTAKGQGTSQYKLYEVVEEESQRSQRQIQQEVHEGLKNDQFVLYYQPRVSLVDGRVVGAEALIRWRHPEKDLLPPAAFLPHIEGSADEIALGEWVVGQALKQLAEWSDMGIDLPVSINISPEHIQKPGFAEFLREALAAYPPELAHKVELEILETSAIGDLGKVAEVMNECAETGVSFSLDDFGTGYSSLTYFHQLPISILKIDQNFVRNMIKESGDLEIVKGVIHLAKTLNRPVVAEGVENAELGFMLLELGCEYAQGYGIARPMPTFQVERWMQEWAANREWQDLSRGPKAGDYSLELKTALFSQRRWQASVMKYLTASGAAERPLTDYKKSELSRWYKGIGQVRFAEHALYSFIPPRHRLAHKLAHELVEYIDEGDMEEALTVLEMFNNACADLMDKLQKLEDD